MKVIHDVLKVRKYNTKRKVYLHMRLKLHNKIIIVRNIIFIVIIIMLVTITYCMYSYNIL